MSRETYSDREYRRQEALRVKLVDHLNTCIMSKCSQNAYIDGKNRIMDSARKCPKRVTCTFTHTCGAVRM